MAQDFSTTIGLSANATSVGQAIDFDNAAVSNVVVTNNSGISIQYSLDGSNWTTIANAATASPTISTPSAFRLRKSTSDSYPVPVGMAWTAVDAGVLPSVSAKLRARIAAAGRYPSAMATPPTIGPATTSPTLTSQYAWDSGKISLKCARWTQVGANARAQPVTVDFKGDGTNILGMSGRFEFETSAPKVEIEGLFDGYRIFVDELDGKGWQKAGEIIAADTGTIYYVPIDFTAASTPRKVRKYRVDCGGSSQFAKIRTSVADVVYPTTEVGSVKAVLLGDSFAAGTGATRYYLDGYGVRLGWMLGIDDFHCSGSGGTGIIKTNGTSVGYVNRLTPDVLNVRPDICIIQCTQNDADQTVASVQAGLVSIVNSVRAAGITPVIVGLWNCSSDNPGAATLNTALTATAATLGVTYIDWFTYITGTGKVGATNGTGNSDFATSNDGTHPSDFGHEYRADRLRHAFAAWANSF